MRTDYQATDFARRYARSRALNGPSQQVWAAELARVTDGRPVSTVVDLGAGAGRFWPVFRTVWQPSAIVAVDTSIAMLKQGNGHIGVRRVVGDIEALPVAGSSADVCFCSMVLHYSAEPDRVLSRLREVLRPGGVVCIRTGTPATLGSFDFLRHFPTALRAEVAVMPNQADVERWLTSAGFEDVDLKIVTSQLQESRWSRLRNVWDRGFPSLQLVPRSEFAVGFGRYVVKLAWEAIRGQARTGEATLFATARCPHER
jgi:ubiquinone/menaquinone biosynthesis C-methylase UbiE